MATRDDEMALVLRDLRAARARLGAAQRKLMAMVERHTFSASAQGRMAYRIALSEEAAAHAEFARIARKLAT